MQTPRGWREPPDFEDRPGTLEGKPCRSLGFFVPRMLEGMLHSLKPLRASAFAVPILTRRLKPNRSMATIRASVPHEDRTASEPRENRLEPVILSRIQGVGDNIRVLRLSALDPTHTIKPVKFLPGQWLDTFIPGLPKAGGFTITSTPTEATPTSQSAPYLELAVQKSSNPPAKWLWRPRDEIVGSKLVVRVGGSFTWPPQGVDVSNVDRLVLVAGGVGINPLISILSSVMASTVRPRAIRFLYATKGEPEFDPERILFLPRLMKLMDGSGASNAELSLFLSGTVNEATINQALVPRRTFLRRIGQSDLQQAIGDQPAGTSNPVTNSGVLCYVCGPPKMTDEMVEFLRAEPGMSKDQVQCEKWW